MTDTALTDAAGAIRKQSMWLIVFGILQVFFGFFAMSAPMLTGLAVSIIVGTLILISGFVEVVGAFKCDSWGAGIFRFLGGLIGVVAGALVIAHPLAGLSFLTFLLAFYFIVDGIHRFMVARGLSGVSGSGWILFSSVLGVLLGILILARWPLSGTWAVGVLVGIHILFGGWAKIMVGAAAHSISK